MNIFSNKTGTVIKGKELKGCKLCKVLSEKMKMKGFQYQIGLNEDINPLETQGTCETGLHFILLENVLDFLNFGTKLAIINVSDNEDIYVDGNTFRSHKLTIEKVMSFSEVNTWQFLEQNNVNIIDENNIVYVSELGYLNVLKYLHASGTNIKNCVNAIISASRNGHLEVIKYLHKNGVNINAYDNYAMKCACGNGHLEIIKYFHKNGISIKEDYNNDMISLASKNNHLDAVKYLYRHGAKGNIALCIAAGQGYLDIVEYFMEYGLDGDKALIKAVENNQLDIVKYLNDYGVNLMCCDGTAILYAIENDNIDIVEYFVENKFPITEEHIQYAKRKHSRYVLSYLQNKIAPVS